jgi:hypothetical protein
MGDIVVTRNPLTMLTLVAMLSSCSTTDCLQWTQDLAAAALVPAPVQYRVEQDAAAAAGADTARLLVYLVAERAHRSCSARGGAMP